MSRSERSRLVHRSASTSFSSAVRISCSRARPELQGDALGGAVAKSLLDVVAADDQVRAVVGAAAHQDVDVRIVGVPVIDGDPVELGAEIPLDVGHQLAGEGAKIGHLGRILGRHREPEMMPVVLAPLGEGLRVGVLRR